MRESLCVLALVACASTARADVIDRDRPEPECGAPLACPEGSSPASLSHSSCPSVCRPNAECTSAADCAEYYGEGARCVPTRFCIGIQSEGPGMSEAVLDACDPSGPCGSNPPASGDAPQCSAVSRCVAPPSASTEAPPPAPARGGCAGCAVAPRASGGLAVMALAMLGLASRRLRP